ncbi:MAG: DUF2087 domain-containing protein [bacterium]|nr:DUF2087 domain-containing protein [bacterium]
MSLRMPVFSQPRVIRLSRVEFVPCAGYAFLESLLAAQRRLAVRLPAGWEELAPAAVLEDMGPERRAWLETLFGGVAWGMGTASMVDPAAGSGAASLLRRTVVRTAPEQLWRQAATTLGETAGPPGDAAGLAGLLVKLLAWHAARFERLAGEIQAALEELARAECREREGDPSTWLTGRIAEQFPVAGLLRAHPSPFLGPLAVLLAPPASGEAALLFYGAEAAPPDRAARMEELVAYHRALADPSRMHIVAMLYRGARSAGDLGRELGLAPATISHHLARLRALGLVSATARGGTQVLWQLETGRMRDYGRLAAGDAASLPRPPREDERARTMAAYFRGGRLVEIPRKRSRREHILREVARVFERGTDYSEAEVNAKLGKFHDDFARLRRELVEAGLLYRSEGVYRLAGEGATGD